MSNKHASPSKQRGNLEQIKRDSESSPSFLSRYFHSKQFVFPELDHDNLNSKILSLTKLANSFERETLDFKSWILNSYPMSSYFKNIVLNDKSTKIFYPSNSSFKDSQKHQKSIYIGQTHSNMKHGYGFEIKIWHKVSEEQQENSMIEFEAYEGFYANNIRHGKGKYFSNSINSGHPNFYYGRFVNGQSSEQNTAFMVWANNDFYIGKVRPFFTKQGMGVLFITAKNNSHTDSIPFQITIKKDPYFYQKVIISDWQSNTTKSQYFSNSSTTLHNMLSQTKIINHSQYYFGQAYVYYSTKTGAHISIKQGNGSLKYLNGDVYQGAFTFDKISGYGKYLWANQNYYIGQFVDGLKEGTGFWKDITTHDEYQGEYNNNRRNGKGEYRWGNGNIYNGQFRNDLREGFGKMIWATGQIYEGSWKDGLQNGIGSLYLLNHNNHVFVRESEFVNGVEMEKGQNFQPLPVNLDRKRQSNFSIKSQKHSHFSSSRRKSLPFESELRKYHNASSLPKINEKTASKFRKQSNLHLKSQPNEFTQESMPKKVPKLASIIEKNKKQKTLDCTQTQKLPYHRSIGKPISKTQKIEHQRISSYFSGSIQKENRRKIFCVDVAVQSDLEKETQQQQRRIRQCGNEAMLVDKYKKLNDILSDSLLLPIKWRNIKRKSHNFILQRKQKNQSHDQSFS